ncbi:MAG TPA: alpha/beta fold hydrolase [Candidatus Dormibacteraeota bacterium]|nr:alpha/beta fold hydrolase [Candidatus Dormibacteraeota bacterium]
MDLIHAAYEPAGAGPHPTLIALHGWGANALDLLGLAPHLGDGRLLVLCPQGPLEVPIGPGMNGYGWFPITMGAPPDPAAFARSVDELDAFLAAAQRRYPIAGDRVAVLGFSQGGVMAYALALRHGRALAAVAALSTWFAPGLAGAASLAGLPVLVQHGTRDELIDVSRGRESVEALRAAGAEVRYREYEMGHEISAASLRDLAGFLGEQLLSRIVMP